jgi:atlastin
VINIDDDGNTFDLNDTALLSVLSSVPQDMSVSVVSVVGAFRTGKSFMLDWMLRYLNATSGQPVDDSDEPDQSWMQAGGDLGGNHNVGGKDKGYGFGWRSGRERMTTGIWMWSEHFVRTMPETGEQVAVLLVDTQGMFDSSLTQMLTASIFGLSTLISSYQVYNVDKQIQEDNLQHLALFTEYGRVALREQRTKEDSDPEWYSTEDGEMSGSGTRPFQRVEFLVRDWQNFDDEDDEVGDCIALLLLG